jgi:hypothetical protein
LTKDFPQSHQQVLQNADRFREPTGYFLEHTSRTIIVKNHLRALFVGAGVNLRRAARWLAGERPKPRPNRLALALAAG